MKARAAGPVRKGIVAGLAALCLAGCSPARENTPASPVLATVNGQPITVAQFRARAGSLAPAFSNHSGEQTKSGEAKMDLLGQLIEEAMYLQEAARTGVAVTDEEVEGRLRKVMADYPDDGFEKALKRDGISLSAYREDLKRRLTVEKLMEKEAYPKTSVSPAEARKYFERHKDDFRRPFRVRARQIVVDNRPDAEAILKEIKKSRDFAALARARSLSPDSAYGGDLGYFGKGEMPPEFEAALFRMKPGDTSPVVKTPYGYHIFRLEDVQKAKSPRFEEVEPQVLKALSKDRHEDAFTKWQEDLKARTSIKVNSDILGSL